MTDLIKFSELTSEASPALGDLIAISKDTGGGSFASRKATIANILSKPKALVTIPYSSTISTNASLGVNFKVAVLEGAMLIANPSNLITGEEYKWVVQQGDTGYSVTFGSLFDIPSGQLVATTANSVSIVRAFYDGDKLRTQIQTGYLYVPPPFAIETIPTLRGWVRAQDISASNGDTVTSWTPPSVSTGLPTFTAPGSGGVYTTNVHNGLPAIKAAEGFNSFRFSASSVTFSPSFTIIAVIKFQSSGGPYGVSAGGSATVDTKSQSTPHFRAADSSLSNISDKNLTNGWATSAAKIIRHECDGTHAGHKVYINGVEQTLTDGSNTANPGTGTATRNLYLFGNALDAVYLENNYLFEQLFCSSKISGSDAFAIETTFSNYYGIALE